jgi:3-oxoacyl-[acyl-carrier-protein] synthase II
MAQSAVSTDVFMRRVVVTGLGIIAANGCDLATFWESVVKGSSAGRVISRFDTSNLPNQIAAEIPNFQPNLYMTPRQGKRLDLSIQYGIAASKLALQNSGLDVSKYDPDRGGVVEATSVGGMESTLKAYSAYLQKGVSGMSAFTFLNAYCGGGSGEIALELGMRGHAITYCSGSCSGNDAIGYALKMIQTDETDFMVAGGTEAPLLEGFWNGFCVTKVMTRRNATPRESMRPFDATRDGFLLGEGAAFLVLEELSHALGRGARIYGEVIGHGRSCEAYHSVAPHPEGIGMSRAIEKALRAARVASSEVNYINAHGTATTSNDTAETNAIKRIWGRQARKIAVSSTKPVTGHLLGAAGALETVICVLALKHQVIPPTINLNTPAPGCDLDYVPRDARPYPLKVAMNLNTGFGGKNSTLILRRFPSD